MIQNRTAPDSEYVTDKYHMDTLVIEPPETEDVFVAAHMTSTNDNGTPSNSGGKPSALPQTGDDSPSGVLAAGLGALGAAVLAYERRRAENEE